MNYGKIIDSLRTYAEAYTGFEFVVVGEQQINSYQTQENEPSKHLIMLEPPQHKGTFTRNSNYIKSYDCVFAFMGHVEQDTDFNIKQDRVNVLDQYATHFVQSLQHNSLNVSEFGLVEIGNTRIRPFHRFSYNSQHMCGVTLEFSIETPDLFDYCNLQEFEQSILE